MKVTIHNITYGHFDLDIDDEETVGSIKQKIRALKNYPVCQQEIIFERKFFVDYIYIIGLLYFISLFRNEI